MEIAQQSDVTQLWTKDTATALPDATDARDAGNRSELGDGPAHTMTHERPPSGTDGMRNPMTLLGEFQGVLTKSSRRFWQNFTTLQSRCMESRLEWPQPCSRSGSSRAIRA